jgi:hypothetical protein
MPRMGFESTIQMFKREKSVHVLDRVATVKATTLIAEKVPPLNKGQN